VTLSETLHTLVPMRLTEFPVSARDECSPRRGWSGYRFPGVAGRACPPGGCDGRV